MGTYSWEEYYENVWEWTTREAVDHIAEISSFGSSEEIWEVINEIAFEDKNGAVCLLKAATDAGIKFTGEHFASLDIDENDPELKRAIRFSSDQFTDADIEELEDFFDDDFVIEIARSANLRIPKDLLEVEENDQEEIADLYDDVLWCLLDAHEHLKRALSLSIADVRSKKRALSIAKHACIADAERCINEAMMTLEELEQYEMNVNSVKNIRLNMGKWIIFHDTFGDGMFIDLAVQRRIQKMLKAVEKAYEEVQILKKKH